MAKASDEDVKRAFFALVNLSAKELTAWLEGDLSKSVGWSPDGGESIGHASGRRIVVILKKKRAALDSGDLSHMRKVVGFIRRHLGQGPRQNVETSRWRYSLMNWGPDPLRGCEDADSPWV